MRAVVSKPHLLSRIASITLGKTIGGPGASIQDHPEPTISPDEILVRVRAVALNPTDYKHIDAVSPPGCVIGCDYAGEVAQVGGNAAKTWAVGDRVAGAVHGGLFPDRGAFAEYLKTDSDLAWKIPADIDDAAAATFGVSAVTAMLTLNVRLHLPWAEECKVGQEQQQSAPAIFIYAGSTSAGLFTIQLARLAGYTVVTTASPHSFDLVKSYGANAVFNYRDDNVADAIVKEYPDIRVAVDCFSEGKSFGICDAVLKNKGGRLITLLPPAKPKYPGVEHELVMAYTLFGRSFQWLAPFGPKFPALPDDRKALARFYASLPELVSNKTVRPPPITLEEGSWDGILTGLDKLRSGKVSGGKLVVKL
ncbi:chaperonin 10-like protein [Lasiosphaeria miniovina]|uniref:Chaperonin 10-like protein n=1 Tax=Lasiosphaeria miniovina TaxID=1954250 RepID=A0AA39ZYL9_9PEZI|nr:chaperonin 10-like protein [Lasiosphaeria miniovina]KAK0706005.1 chaperonin 10-like protein [Lasiosphaeria miniovina]